MKSSMKGRLPSLNLFNKCGSCAPVSSCCDPCGSFSSGGYVMDGVVGEYSPYSMQAPVYQTPPMQYSLPPAQHYQYAHQPMTVQPPCSTCQNHAAQAWPQYPPAAPTYAQPGYPPSYNQQPTQPQNWQQPYPAYQYPQPAQPQPVLPQPSPQPAPATTGLQPMPAPAAQVSYLPGYSHAVPPVRQAIR
jgi:hypothetical protein